MRLLRTTIIGSSLLVAAVLTMGTNGCHVLGVAAFYPDPHFGGDAFTARIDNSSGSVKWDGYDYDRIVGNDTISSLEAEMVDPTTLILCDELHFRGDFKRFHVQQPLTPVGIDLTSDDAPFDNRTSSIIATNEDVDASALDDSAIDLSPAPSMFQAGLVENLRAIGLSRDDLDFYGTQVYWDTKLNVLAGWGDAAYSAEFEDLKNADVIRFYQSLEITIPLIYDPSIRVWFWIEPTNSGGNLGFSCWAWEYYVEGIGHNEIADALEPRMPGLCNQVATQLDTAVRSGIAAACAPFLTVLPDCTTQITTGISRISFTLPDPEDPEHCNRISGYWSGGSHQCGRVETTPPTVILQHR